MTKISPQKFEEAYKKLNKNQKEAVDQIDGPVMVVAGPGAGKTSILTLRIANILKQTDTDPENILALTFTESGVKAMREKLITYVGPLAYRVNIFTFHGFANYLIGRYPEMYERIVGGSAITDTDKIRIIERIVKSEKLNFLKPKGNPDFYIKSISNTITHLKREKIDPKSYLKFIKTDGAEDDNSTKRSFELQKVFNRYDLELEKNSFYDFEDMILETIKALEDNKDFLLELQETYQYVLADEHQDANNAQNRILELLSSYDDSPNLFIVGDEKQAIFRFQGASLENFLYFQDKFKKTKLIKLTDNYRSHQTILDGAHELISNNKISAEINSKLTSQSEVENKNIVVNKTNSLDDEDLHIVSEVKKLIDSNVPAEEIAIIYRQNKDIFNLAKIFEKQNIPFTIQSNQNLLDNHDVSRLIYIFEAINNPGDEEKLIKALSVDVFEIDPVDVWRFSNEISFKKESFSVKINLLSKEKFNNWEKVQETLDKINKWAVEAKNKHLLYTFEEVLNDSGLLEQILKSESSYERLSAIESLFNEARNVSGLSNDYKLADFLNYLKALEVYSMEVTVKKSPIQRGVQCLTVHRAKGLEFEHVFIIRAVESKWSPNKRGSYFLLPDSEKSDISDERRLFYVALTRAKKDISIYYSDTNESGRDELPSRFISEIPENLKDYNEIGEVGGKAELILRKEKGEQRTENEISRHDKEYLNNLFLNQKFSVTALNNYLMCPWNFFYNNLLRLPSTYSSAQVYGTAAHATTRDFYDGKLEDVVESFKKHIGPLPVDIETKENLILKATENLPKFIETLNKDSEEEIHTEFAINDVTIELDSGKDLKLTGKLDLVEIKDGKVKVTDFKTSKPKSVNQIEGKTQNSTGNEKRQLVFYKLLTDKHYGGKYEMKNGELSFTEPDQKGNYIKRSFEITDGEVKKLEDKIKETSKEILELSFWNKKCDDKDCEFCKLRKLVK